LDIPKYEIASKYVEQIEKTPIEGNDIKLEIAEFYVHWSNSIKRNREIDPDPIKEILRQRRYKELAEKALFWLDQIKDKDDRGYYLLSRSYFNSWDNPKALESINRAIALCGRDSTKIKSYSHLRELILWQQQKMDK